MTICNASDLVGRREEELCGKTRRERARQEHASTFQLFQLPSIGRQRHLHRIDVSKRKSSAHIRISPTTFPRYSVIQNADWPRSPARMLPKLSWCTPADSSIIELHTRCRHRRLLALPSLHIIPSGVVVVCQLQQISTPPSPTPPPPSCTPPA